MIPAQPNDRARDRTRSTILRSAITVLVTTSSAPVARVASAAGVARSTLHRYFPDRAALLEGIEAFVDSSYDDALDRAGIDDGTGHEAFERLLGELLDRLDIFAWWMHHDDPQDDFTSPADERIVALLERGQKDHSIDPSLDPRWVVIMIWSLIYAVFMETQAGHRTERELREMCLQTLLKVTKP